MNQTVDHFEQGFQFPGVFHLSAMGPADRPLETDLPSLLEGAGVRLMADEEVICRYSSNKRYVSVRIGFFAASRAEYEKAHQVLCDHPDVKWTL